MSNLTTVSKLIELDEQLAALDRQMGEVADGLTNDELEAAFGKLIDDYVKENRYENRTNLAFKIESEGIDYFIRGYSYFPTSDTLYYILYHRLLEPLLDN